MEPSKIFYKKFNWLLPFADFTYILQLEEYSSRRFLKWLPRFFFRRNFQVREELKYTKRVKITLGLIIIIWLISLAAWISFTRSLILGGIGLLVWLITIPIFTLIGNILITPYFETIKRKIREGATKKVANLPNLKIVTVAGSYGKTTVKNFIYQLVQYNYRTQMIPGNINTPAGIAVWINNNLQSKTELLINEVDAYEVGEIAKSCDIASPDIAVLTNISDQHLERFGNESALTKALSEVFTRSKSNAHLIATKDTFDKADIDFKDRNQIIVKTLATSHKHLSASNQINLEFALQVARLLRVPERIIKDTLNKLELPDRRQKNVDVYGYEAIDDSYNISFTTAQAGVAAAKAAATKASKRLLVITAGIPELSYENFDKNRQLGEILAKETDFTIILRSMFAEEIMAGFTHSTKFSCIEDFNTFVSNTRHDFPIEEWFLLLQPELGDLYY